MKNWPDLATLDFDYYRPQPPLPPPPPLKFRQILALWALTTTEHPPSLPPPPPKLKFRQILALWVLNTME